MYKQMNDGNCDAFLCKSRVIITCVLSHKTQVFEGEKRLRLTSVTMSWPSFTCSAWYPLGTTRGLGDAGLIFTAGDLEIIQTFLASHSAQDECFSLAAL
jgi:hypothetical protein